MNADESRRFTDREFAVILQKASEIEEAEATGGGRGLTLRDLHEIAREVGISEGSIDRAVGALGRPRGRGISIAGSPLVRRAVHAVEGRLDEDAMARLVHLVDERTDGAGSVSEALGSVRWTSRDRFKSTQISLTPQDSETIIQVVEKAAPHLRALFHALPGAWGGMIALVVAAPLGLAGLGLASAVAGGVVVGVGAGRAAWSGVSGRSGRRVERLAAGLAQAARRTPKSGDETPAE